MDFDSNEAINIRLIVLQAVVKTLVQSHPDPQKLLSSWSEASAGLAITDVAHRPANALSEQAAQLKTSIAEWTDLIQKRTRG